MATAALPTIQEAINSLLPALEAAYSPHSTDQLRLQATTFLESFKQQQQPLYILQVSLQLIKNPDYNTHTRHFAFQAFEAVLDKSYNTLPPSDKDIIKNEILQLMKPAEQYTAQLINYKQQQASILTSKLVTLVVKIMQFDWPQQWPALFPTLFNYYETTPSIDYCLFLSEVLTKILDLTGQPSTAIPDKKRKEIFAQVVKILQDFLPRFLQHFETLLAIISGDFNATPSTQYNLQQLLQAFPNLNQALNNFNNKQTPTIQDPQLRWYIKHALEISMQLFQHVSERINLNENTTSLISLLAMLLSLPQVCDEACEQVLVLLKRRTGVPLQHHPRILLQLWETLLELSFRLLSRQSICNQRYILFPQPKTNTLSLQYFSKQQPLLVKVLRCVSQLISAYSQAITGILGKNHATIRNIKQMCEQHNTPPTTQQLGEVAMSEQLINSINQIRTNLLKVLCRAACDLDCSDLICNEALVCLIECTNPRLYHTYITNSFLRKENMIEAVLKEIWNVILINNDREKHARLQNKTLGGVLSTGGNVLDQYNDDDNTNGAGGLGPNSVVHDFTGNIRSGLQTIAKNLADRQPHMILKLITFTYHQSVVGLCQLVEQEKLDIQQTQQFPSTVSSNSKEVDYVFQTTAEFNKALYPAFHYGGRKFFISQAFLFLDGLITVGKSVFQKIQSLIITIQQNPIENNNFQQQQKVELTSDYDFENVNAIPPHHLEGLYTLLADLHQLLMTCPQNVLGYVNYSLSLLVKLTPLYAHSQQHLNQTLQHLLSLGSLNPNGILSGAGKNDGSGSDEEKKNFVGQSAHDGMSYNAFFIDQTTQHALHPTQPDAAMVLKQDLLSATAGNGADSINLSPLLDLRKHSFHAILHLCKFLPQAFENIYQEFCHHILKLIQQSKNENQNQQQQNQQQQVFVTMPTETVVLIEILLCLALYYQNQELIQSTYTHLIAPHCQFLLTSLDLAYFTADIYRFSTLMYGSHDEYKLMQFQLLQWGELNQLPQAMLFSDQKNNNNQQQQSLSSDNNNDEENKKGENNIDLRANALPRACTLPIMMPTTTNNNNNNPITQYDNRYQSFRKQLLFALHTVQCITKLLYTQTIAGDSSTVLSLVSSHKYNQQVGNADTSASLSVDNNTTSAQANIIKMQQQANIAKDMLTSIIQQVYPTMLKLLTMFLTCSTESFLSTISNRLHPIAISNNFDSFLSLFTFDGFFTTQQPEQKIYGNQTLLDSLWNQSNATTAAMSPDNNVFSGYLDTTYLPTNTQLPPQQIKPQQTKILPADKSQYFLRHLWAWNDNFFESLTQMFTFMNQLLPDVVSCDILAIPHIVEKVQDAFFLKTNPLQSLQLIIQQTLVSTTQQPVLQVSSAEAWKAYTPYLWNLIFALIPSLPLKKQRLFVQRFLQPVLKTLPLKPLSQPQNIPLIASPQQQQEAAAAMMQQQQQIKPLLTQHPLYQQLQQDLLSTQLLPKVLPLILQSLTSIFTTTLRDTTLYNKFGSLSPSASITTMSPTLSLLADGIGNSALSLNRRLRGVTSHFEHLRFLQVFTNPTNTTLQTHTPSSLNTPAEDTKALYKGLTSQQHIVGTTPLTAECATYLHQQQQQTPQNPNVHNNFNFNHLTTEVLPCGKTALDQQQQQIFNTIQQELQQHLIITNQQQQQLPTSSAGTYKMLQFPTELELLQQDIASILKRYDFSRVFASHQQQTPQMLQQQPHLKMNKVGFVGGADPLHQFADHIDFTEFAHYCGNITSVMQLFCSTPVNNERSLTNALGMLKQSQMFLALPLCSRLAEVSSVHPDICYMLSNLWENLVFVNCNMLSNQSATIATKHMIAFLRYVGVVLCYASICTAQREQQLQMQQQGLAPPQQVPYQLDAMNTGLLFRQMYYQSNTKKQLAREQQQQALQNQQQQQQFPQNIPNAPSNNNPADQGKYAGLVIKKQPEDIIQALIEAPTSAASLVFTHDDYWLYLAMQQQQHPEAGLTATFLAAAPGLLQWLQSLYTSATRVLQRHFYATTVLDLSQRQQQQEQAVGSPILDQDLLDVVFILARDVLTLLTQCTAFVNNSTLVSFLQQVVQPVANTKANAPTQQLTQPCSPETAGLLIEYARSIDVDDETNNGSSKTTETSYFSYTDLLNNKKGVMSEKNNSTPNQTIPTQTRQAKEQFKALLYDIIIKSFQ